MHWGGRAYYLWEIVSMTSDKNNNSTSCENDTISNFKLSKNVELRKKWQLFTDACIVNSL